MVAVILGTGTNACYIERKDSIPKLQGHVSASGRTVYMSAPTFFFLLFNFSNTSYSIDNCISKSIDSDYQY